MISIGYIKVTIPIEVRHGLGYGVNSEENQQK